MTNWRSGYPSGSSDHTGQRRRPFSVRLRAALAARRIVRCADTHRTRSALVGVRIGDGRSVERALRRDPLAGC